MITRSFPAFTLFRMERGTGVRKRVRYSSDQNVGPVILMRTVSVFWAFWIVFLH